MASSDLTAPHIEPKLVLSHKFPEATFSYDERDVAMYALGVGACGGDAVDEKELKFVYDINGQQFIKVLPTFAALFPFKTSTGTGLDDVPGLEFDPRLLLHGQQYMEIYRPFPSNSCVENKVVIAGLHDKGKATIIELETTSYIKESGEVLCMNRSTIYLRGAGGFSNSSPPYSYTNYPANQVSRVSIPKSGPAVVHEDPTQQSQALLYRLSGDYNPLHSDPMIAQVAGFSRPILHGLCTLGYAVRAIIKSICNGDETAVKNIFGRFLLHVYPGETLVTEMWPEGTKVIFQTKVKERSRSVLSGYVVLKPISSSL
jgi:peroxisomal enoyl-CoA hydratase 2